jgi:hypothetical protein
MMGLHRKSQTIREGGTESHDERSQAEVNRC